ncbi:enoyl-CoA hydratase/isomerase family protein [Paraburkholderia sp. Cy-641]|nr:enoyl-CoA hydratase/isomerase family protein [Paraburkholderia sp. Cy-641]
MSEFPKPIIVLINDITVTSGTGIVHRAWLRIATESTKIAMPEARIDLLSDAGASYFPVKLPEEIIFYSSLSGQR